MMFRRGSAYFTHIQSLQHVLDVFKSIMFSTQSPAMTSTLVVNLNSAKFDSIGL